MESARRTTSVIAIATVALLGVGRGVLAQAPTGPFVNFESGHVRPLALSPDGSRLFAVNTPDNRLEIYAVSAAGLTLAAEVPVGLEPVAVAARSNTEVWVVNHLSDSVSVVSINAGTPALSHVTRTLLTCDEPRDIVFAGPGGGRAFVTTARRGQNCPVVANLTSAGTGRAVVQVFDSSSLDGTLTGTPIANIAALVSPSAAVVSIWAFNNSTKQFRAGFFSDPAAPVDCNLTGGTAASQQGSTTVAGAGGLSQVNNGAILAGTQVTESYFICVNQAAEIISG